MTTATFLGADPDQLDQLAAHFAALAQQLTTDRAQLTTQLGQAPWTGKGADAFRSAFAAELAPRMDAAAAFLTQSGRDLRTQAQQQRDASADNPFAGGKEASPVEEGLEWIEKHVLPILERAGKLAEFLADPAAVAAAAAQLEKLGLSPALVKRVLGSLERVEPVAKVLGNIATPLGVALGAGVAGSHEWGQDGSLPAGDRVARSVGAGAVGGAETFVNGVITDGAAGLAGALTIETGPGAIAAGIGTGMAVSAGLEYVEGGLKVNGTSLNDVIDGWGASGADWVYRAGSSAWQSFAQPQAATPSYAGAASIGTRSFYELAPVGQAAP